MSRFAIVGCEASGKTVLTAALADYFQPGKDGVSCSMVPENVAAHRFFEYTSYQMRVKHAWPQATNPDKTSVMKWSLRVDGDTVADLETLDFGGEVFRAAFREGAPTENGVAAQQELLEYLSESDFIVVTVSLGVLLRDIEKAEGLTQQELSRDSEAKWVTRGLLDFVRSRLPAGTGVVIALTQADLYRQELEKYGGAKGLFSRSWPTVAALYRDMPVIAVNAVSGVAADGSPAEGYTCEGVIPLMTVFAEYCVGSMESVREAIETRLDWLRNAPEGTDPKEYRRYIDDFPAKIQIFRIVSAMTGGGYDDELKRYIDTFVSMRDQIEKKLRGFEAVAFAEYKAEESRRQQREAEEAAAAEAKRKAEEAAAEKRREEDAKKAEDERIRAEKDLEKSRLEAEVELEKTRAVAGRNRTRIIVAVMGVLAVICVCCLYYVVDGMRRAQAVASLKVQEIQKATFADKVRNLAVAAKDGDLSAAKRILELLENQEIAESDVNWLYEIYMLLVNEGDSRAMYRLGVACHRGTCGVKQSDFNAHWFLTMAKGAGCQAADLDALIAETADEKEKGAEDDRSVSVQ